MSRRKQKIKNTHCPNCDYTFKEIENFCPNCGQDNHSHNLPLKHYIIEFLESTLHFDTKILQTFKLLLLKPGQLTKEFNNNIRAKYVPPIRLYIFISVLFFGVIALLPKNYVGLNVNGKKIENEDAPIRYSLKGVNDADYDKIAKMEISDKRIDSLIMVGGHEPNWFFRKIYIHMIETGIKKSITFGEFFHRIYKGISIIMFLLMPVFALYLLLFNYRKKLFYVRHLNFSLHFHSLVFVIMLLAAIFKLILPSSFPINTIEIIGILLYLWFALKNVYDLSWFYSLIKTFFIGVIYSITVAFFLILSLLYAIF